MRIQSQWAVRPEDRGQDGCDRDGRISAERTMAHGDPASGVQGGHRDIGELVGAGDVHGVRDEPSPICGREERQCHDAAGPTDSRYQQRYQAGEYVDPQPGNHGRWSLHVAEAVRDPDRVEPQVAQDDRVAKPGPGDRRA